MDDVFWELTEELRHEAGHEARAQAGAMVASARRRSTFRDELTRALPGDVVTLSLVDGAILAGRVIAVGADWLRLAEVRDAAGAARVRATRIHDVRIDAVTRISREPGT